MYREILRLRGFFTLRDKLAYVGLFVLMIGAAIADVIGVGAIPGVVAALATPDTVMEHPRVAVVASYLGIETSRELIVWACVVLIVLFILKNAYLTFVHYVRAKLTEQHLVRLGSRLFTAYMCAPYEFHLEHNSAELLRNVSAEVREIFAGVINPLLKALLGLLMTAGIVVLLLVLTPWIGVAGIVVMGVGSWAYLRAFRTRLTAYGIKAKNERKESIKAIMQGLGSLVDARVLGRESALIDTYGRSVARFAQVNRMRQVITMSSSPTLETIAVAGVVLVLLTLVFMGSDTAMLVPTLALFGAAVVRLRGSISQVVGGMSQMQFSIPSIANVADHLDLLDPGMEEGGVSRDAERLPFEESLRLRGVGYTYPEGHRPAVLDVDLFVAKGENVAFVGPTGSGKSTLVKILLGLLKPQEGLVLVDGVDIHESCNLRCWHRNIGYVPQSIFLLDDTVRRNVALGVPDGEMDETSVWKALEAAQLADFVRSLPNELDTKIGEDGTRVSGGQRQRIGLARALYPDPAVLILDEATSALDNRTERQVMDAVQGMRGKRTIIMIAHRLSTVERCDRLYYLEDGRVEANGTYQELSANHAGFWRMAGVGGS